MKKAIAILFMILLIFSSSVCAENEMKIIIKGEEIKTDVVPVIINNITFVPLRPIFEKYGYHIEWDEMRGIITTLSGIGEIKLRVGSNLVLANGRNVVIMDSYSRKINGRTFVPLSFIGTCMKTTVNQSDEIISIN